MTLVGIAHRKMATYQVFIDSIHAILVHMNRSKVPICAYLRLKRSQPVFIGLLFEKKN
jgi:hypothetical protein